MRGCQRWCTDLQTQRHEHALDDWPVDDGGDDLQLAGKPPGVSDGRWPQPPAAKSAESCVHPDVRFRPVSRSDHLSSLDPSATFAIPDCSPHSSRRRADLEWPRRWRGERRTGTACRCVRSGGDTTKCDEAIARSHLCVDVWRSDCSSRMLLLGFGMPAFRAPVFMHQRSSRSRSRRRSLDEAKEYG